MFTRTAQQAADAAGISLEIIYVGKKYSTEERNQKINSIITEENLSHCWSNPVYVRYFWKRVESMLFSELQSGYFPMGEKILQEIVTILSFDEDDQGWALISKGSIEMARAKGNIIFKSLKDFASWEEDAKQKDFLPALNEYLERLSVPNHDSRIIRPLTAAGVTELVAFAECGRPMEKFFMFRCCIDE